MNIFGNTTKNKYLKTKNKLQLENDRRFFRIFNFLEQKVSKNGDYISGNLDLQNNKIINVSHPVENGDCANKSYVDENIDKVNAELKTKLEYRGDIMDGSLDLNLNNLNGINFPVEKYDAINKLYIKIFLKRNDISFNRLLEVSDVLLKTIRSVSDTEDIKKFILDFENCFYISSYIFTNYDEFFESKTIEKKNSDIMENFTIYIDLKVSFINIIEHLKENIFKDVKKKFIFQKFLETKQESDFRRFRKFINEISKTLDPSRADISLELAIQKNLLLIDLGFDYISDDLFKLFYTKHLSNYKRD